VRYLHRLFEGAGTSFGNALATRRLAAAKKALGNL
jgi:hypothetical protein